LIRFLKNMKKSWKTAFCSTFFIGLLVHMYKFTNTLLNHDSVYSYYSDLNIIGSGRWFLSTACAATSYFDLPWLIGIVSLVLLAAAAVLVVDIFEMENPVQVVLTGGILAACPGVTQTFFYEFTADGYMLAVFLSALAVWLTRIEMNKRSCEYVRWALAAVCLCLSCGIYQAHVSFGMVLALCCLLYELLKDRHDAKTCWRWAFCQLGLYIVSLAAYYVLWQICMKVQGVQATDYKGISSVGISLHTMLAAIPQVFNALLRFFFEWDVQVYGWTLYGKLNAVFLGGFAACLIGAVFKSGLWKRKGQLALFGIVVLLVPFAACVWMLVSPGMDYNPMMLVSLSILYVFATVLAEAFLPGLWKELAGIFLAVVVFYFSVQANVSYYYMQAAYQTSCSKGTEMLTRIHMLDPGTRQLYVVGNRYGEIEMKNALHAEEIPMLGYALETDLLFDYEHVMFFLNYSLTGDFEKAPREMREWLDTAQEVQEMSCWPDTDSVRVIEDVIVVKLSDP